MAPKRESIEIRVSQQILWIGSQAYPLRNISSTGSLKLTPKRGAAIWRYLKSVFVWAVTGVLIEIALAIFGVQSSLVVAVALGVLALIAVETIRLVSFLKLTYYALTLETSGSSRRALVSKDEAMVSDLVFRITDAINNPLAEFQMKVENFHIGDNVQTFGDHSPGKIEHGKGSPVDQHPMPRREPLVFINYRKADEKAATYIDAELTRRRGPGAVFRDAGMPAGTEFPRELTYRAGTCPVMLVLIGEKWDDQYGRSQLHRHTDWVHHEIATALANGVRVVPVLIGARGYLIADHLPADIRSIAKHQPKHLPDRYDEDDVRRLVDKLLRELPTLR